MGMGFDTCLSGLNSCAKALEVVSNNISNSNTVGFKVAQTQFTDVFAATLSGTASSQAVGLGANAARVVEAFTQGDIRLTNNALDMAINGKGFFRLNNDGAVSYTRNGEFRLESEPFPAGATPTAQQVLDQPLRLVNLDGLRVTGYPATYTTDPTGTINSTGTPQDVVIDPHMSSVQTTNVVLGLNLDARLPLPSNSLFSAADADSYSYSTSFNQYDATGNATTVSLYFVKTDTLTNAWDMHATDGSSTFSASLMFDSLGQITPAASALQALSFTSGNAFTLDLSGTTQYASLSSVHSITQDGYADGQLTHFNVDSQGIIQASFSNGQSRKAAQVVLANFSNPAGLTNTGNNQWVESYASGPEILDTPANTDPTTSKGMGSIQGTAVEEANIDLNQELVNLIVQQRYYQANAQAVKTQDQILQTLAGIR